MLTTEHKHLHNYCCIAAALTSSAIIGSNMVHTLENSFLCCGNNQQSIPSVSYPAICLLPMKSPSLQAKCRLQLQHIERDTIGAKLVPSLDRGSCSTATRPPACPQTPNHIMQLASHSSSSLFFVLLPPNRYYIQCADYNSTA